MNIMKRINNELKRKSKDIGVFLNQDSLLRLTVSILIDINEEGITDRRYLPMEEE